MDVPGAHLHFGRHSATVAHGNQEVWHHGEDLEAYHGQRSRLSKGKFDSGIIIY